MDDGIILKSGAPTMSNAAAVTLPPPAGVEGARLMKQAGTPMPRVTPPTLTPQRTFEEAGGKCSVAAQTINQGSMVERSASPLKFKAPTVAGTSTPLHNNGGGEGSPSQEVSTTAMMTSHVTGHMQVAPHSGDAGRSSSGEKALSHANKVTPTSGNLSPASSEHSSSSHDDRDPSLFNKQVAKLKRFFTTLQEFANKISQEVAEQVQELITALVNGTVTVVEFHQEIQSVTNHPLKEFIIPFLKESLDPLRQHLKTSSQDIADILEVVQTPGPNLGLTPQLIDSELPVLPSTKPPCFVSTPSPSSLTTQTANPITRVSSSPPPRPSNLAIFSSGSMEDSSELSPPSGSPPAHNSGSRKRSWNTVQDKGRGQNPDLDKDRGHSLDPDKVATKRPRPPVPSDLDSVIPSTEVASLHSTPTLQQVQSLPAHFSNSTPSSGTVGMSNAPTLMAAVAVTPSVVSAVTPAVPSDVRTVQTNSVTSSSLPATMAVWLNEDWGHIDVMLGAIQQMLEKTHNAVNTLRDRLAVVELAIQQTRTEQERKEELEKEVERRVSEAVEKVRLTAAEERQKLLAEASKHMIDSLNSMRGELEGRMSQAQALAIEEALKQANMQSNTRETCWNCGRRATETCSGCNKARYCGTFCQHKDWSKHMRDCSSGMQGMEIDREQENSDKSVVGHGNDMIRSDRRVDTPRARGSLSSDPATQGRDEEKKAFASLPHPGSLI